jgi:hypothetical protein
MPARTFLLVAFACLLAACASQPLPASPTPTAQPSATSLPTDTLVPTPALQVFTETMTEVPSDTLPPPAVTATVDPSVATSIALMGPMGALMNIDQYYHPVGGPVKTWRDVPVMPEAVAGQEYPPYIYSYTADATLDQARLFYAPLVASFGITFPPATGSSGIGVEATHNVTFFSQAMGIVLTTFDNDPSHVIVVIAKEP